MRQTVVRYKCDSCHTVVEDPQAGLARSRVPKDWLHVDGFSNSHSVFKLDLCDQCKLVILKITEGD